MSSDMSRQDDTDPAALRQRLAAELTRAVVRAEKRRGRAIDRHELSRRLSVSPSSVYAYLNGTTLASVRVFDELLSALGVTGPEAGRLSTLRDSADTARRLRATRAGAAPPLPRVPHQLPLARPGFVAREAEIDRLDSLLETQDAAGARSTVVAVVEGTAGVGKTSLALHWARRVQDRFPDGQLHVNLRSFSSEAPMDPGEALHGFLQALGVAPAAVPADQAVASALLRTLLAGRRMLLLLDNARSAEQVRPLIPSDAGSVAVVTSRNRLDGLVVREGALRVSLDVLPRHAARDLLERRIGTQGPALEPAATDELVDLCARLPLALSVAAARATMAPARSIGHLVTELREAQARLDVLGLQDADLDLRTVFQGSYALLPSAAARLFRLLGCHPGPDVDGLACAALMDERTPPRVLLDTLSATHLVQEQTPGRFAPHDLLWLYAKELTELGPAEEHRAGTERLFRHYLDSARLADHHLEPWRPLLTPAGRRTGTEPPVSDHVQAMAWFETELATLQNVMTLAAVTDSFEAYAWELARACAVYLRRSGRRVQRASVHSLAREAASRAGNRLAWATGTRQFADALSRLHRTEEALDLLFAALRECHRLEDREGTREVRLSLVRVYASRGDHRRALPHARLALAMAEQTREPLALAEGLTALAQQQEQLNHHAVALEHGRRALDLYTELDHLDGRAGILLSMGRAEQGLGRHAEAIGHYESSLALDRLLGDRYREAHALNHLADARGELGHHQDARRLLDEALALFDELRHPDAARVRAQLRRTHVP